MGETPSRQLEDLILSLERATHMAKQLPTSSNPTQLLQICASFHSTLHHLSIFLAPTQFPNPQFPQPQVESENLCFSGADDNWNEPMQVADEDGVEVHENSKASHDKVGEKMGDCFIQDKRPKRPLSPLAMEVVDVVRFDDDGFGGKVEDFYSHKKVKSFGFGSSVAQKQKYLWQCHMKTSLQFP